MNAAWHSLTLTHHFLFSRVCDNVTTQVISTLLSDILLVTCQTYGKQWTSILQMWNIQIDMTIVLRSTLADAHESSKKFKEKSWRVPSQFDTNDVSSWRVKTIELISRQEVDKWRMESGANNGPRLLDCGLSYVSNWDHTSSWCQVTSYLHLLHCTMEYHLFRYCQSPGPTLFKNMLVRVVWNRFLRKLPLVKY